MNHMFGMSIEQVRALSSQLDAAGNDVEQIIATLTTGLAAAPWVGNDRNSFEDEWSSTHTPSLRNAAEALRHAANAANQNVRDQVQASGR